MSRGDKASAEKSALGSNKRAERLVAARLALKRAEREIATKPQAQATVLIRDMRMAMIDVLDELEKHC